MLCCTGRSWETWNLRTTMLNPYLQCQFTPADFSLISTDPVHSHPEPGGQDAVGQMVHELRWWREAEADWGSACGSDSARCKTHQLCGGAQGEGVCSGLDDLAHFVVSWIFLPHLCAPLLPFPYLYCHLSACPIFRLLFFSLIIPSFETIEEFLSRMFLHNALSVTEQI